jgi:hypothetical protein
MSYDISLNEVPCPCCKRGERLGCMNMTSNVSGMWAKALGKNLVELDETKAGSSIELLEKGIQDMTDHRSDYVSMSPKNGWGSIDSARETLVWMLILAKEYPESIININ